jgi:hypothetical protein
MNSGYEFTHSNNGVPVPLGRAVSPPKERTATGFASYVMLDGCIAVLGPDVFGRALAEHEVPCVGLAGEKPTEEAKVGALLSLWAEGSSCGYHVRS